MDSTTSIFSFYYYLELWRRRRERDRREAELAGEVSGVFERRNVCAGEDAATTTDAVASRQAVE